MAIKQDRWIELRTATYDLRPMATAGDSEKVQIDWSIRKETETNWRFPSLIYLVWFMRDAPDELECSSNKVNNCR